MFGVDDIILGATIAGAATSGFGAFSKRRDQDKLTQLQIQEEELRRKQMEYDAMRQQRQLVRNAQAARAMGISNQVNSGAGQGSSASGGAAGQVQGQEGVSSNSIFQNLQIGEKIFDSRIAQAKMKNKIGTDQDIVGLGQTMIGMGKPLGNMFGGRSQSQDTFGNSPGGSEPFGGNTEFGVM